MLIRGKGSDGAVDHLVISYATTKETAGNEDAAQPPVIDQADSTGHQGNEQ